MPKRWSDKDGFSRPQPVNPADIDAIAALERENPSPWGREQIKSELAQATGFSLCIKTRGGEMAAYIMGRMVVDEAEILKFAVAERYRRLGLGRSLLAAALVKFTEKGAGCCFLEVRAGNLAAISLYENFGFTSIARRHNYYNDPVEDAICMSAILEPDHKPSPADRK